MARPVSIAVGSLLAILTFAACAGRTETGPGPEEPPLGGPVKTAEPPNPRLAFASQSGDGGHEGSAPSTPGVPPSACPSDMVLADGMYCTEVRQDCIDWMDPPSQIARCRKFAPSVCLGERVHKRFCVDRDEYVPPGQTLPLG